MKKLFLTTTILVGFAGAAGAADLPVYKTPRYTTPPVQNSSSWSGFYVGVNVGYSWGQSQNDWNTYSPVAGPTGPLPSVCPPAFTASLLSAGVGRAVCLVTNDSLRMNGVTGGAQAGYNWQFSNFVLGFETDFQGSSQKGSQTSFFQNEPVTGLTGGPVIQSDITATYEEKIDWFGTVRGRLGVSQDQFLLYGTGGLAYGRVSTSGSAVGTVLGPVQNGSALSCSGGVVVQGTGVGQGVCGFTSWNDAQTRVGWAAGAGAEGRLFGNWSWKIEYLHVDLGRVTTPLSIATGCFGLGAAATAVACSQVAPGTGTITSRIRDEIVRVGLNYRLTPG